MFTPQEEKILKECLSLAPEPDITFTYQEFSGYLFGLAMTPENIPFQEWFSVVFGGTCSIDAPPEKLAQLHTALKKILQRLSNCFSKNTLTFPFAIDHLKENHLPMIFEWTSGFEEALVLREEIWDPEEHPRLPEKRKEELFFSMIAIQGMVEPIDVMNYFQDLPDNIFQETFPGITAMNVSRETQIQLYLLASLPLSIDTLQKHARTIVLKTQKRVRPDISSIPFSSNSLPNMPPTPESTEKKQKSAKIIKVDFSGHHGKRR